MAFNALVLNALGVSWECRTLWKICSNGKPWSRRFHSNQLRILEADVGERWVAELCHKLLND